MDDKTKIIAIGVGATVGFVILMVGLTILYKRWKAGKFATISNKIKSMIYGDMISSIEFTKESGIIEITEVVLLDKAGVVLNDKSKYKFSYKELYNNLVPDKVMTIQPTTGPVTLFHSGLSNGQFLKIDFETPVPKVHSISVMTTSLNLSRIPGTRMVVKSVTGKVMFDETTQLSLNKRTHLIATK